MTTAPVIKIEVLGDNVDDLGRTLVSLAAKVSSQEGASDVSVSEDMPLDELLAVVRRKATAEGFKLLVVKADAETEEGPSGEGEAQTYEPKAVKRRGRPPKAKTEEPKVETPAVEEAEEEPASEMTLWEDEPAAAEEETLTDAQLEEIKRETIKKLMPIYKSKGGPERVKDILSDWKQYASVSTIPAKHFPEIARRIDA